MKRRAEPGVGFVLSPSVEVHEVYEPSEYGRGRLLALRVSVAGLHAKLINCYAPHEGLADSTQDRFYRALNGLSNILDKFA